MILPTDPRVWELNCGLAGQASGFPVLMAWIAPELICGLIGVRWLIC